MARLVRPGVACAVLVVAVAPLAAGAAGGAATGDDLAACREHVAIRDGWARIDGPAYDASQGAGARVIAASAAPETLARRVFVTNGSVVKMSATAGCTWDPIYPKENRVGPPDVAEAVVTHLVAPNDAALWLASYDSSGGVPRPHVAMTPDASFAPGNTTKVPIANVDDGLPATGRPVSLLVPARAETAYLLLEQQYDPDGDVTGLTRNLYRLTADTSFESLTGSKRYTWTKLALPADLPGVTGVAMSSRQTDTVWAWHGRTYAWTDDGGAHWRSGRAAGEITTVDVDDAAVPGVFSRSGEGGLLERLDRTTGRVRERIGTPVVVTAVAHGSRSGTYAVAGQRRAYGYDGSGHWVDITPADRPAFGALHFGATAKGERILLGRAGEALYRFDLFPRESFVPVPTGTPVSPVPSPGPPGVLGFTPRRQVVTVAPGELADAPLAFHVPPSPARIDVFFLIDTTSSMTAAIKGLREGVRHIADEVTARTRGEACFGLGEVKDFSVADNPWYGAAAITPYKLQKKITCDLDELSEGLAALREGGGDKYPEEAQTIGLTQAVKGDGQVKPPVPPGQDAGFVAKTRVIVLITDAGFKMAPEFDGFPAMDETVDTLMKFGGPTHVVGVLLQTRNALAPAIRDMTEVAARTNTFAPAGGADCDGDGLTDVAPGAPLVCLATNYAPSIAPAIIALLLGVKQPATVDIGLDDPHGVVAGLRAASGALAPTKKLRTFVNIRVPNTVPITPVLTCSAAQDGLDLPVGVVGTVTDHAAAAEIMVRCRGPRHPGPPPPTGPPPPPPGPDPAPRHPLLPVLVLPVQPPPVNNPPPNLNVNAGFSQQEEEQYQVATVAQDAAEDDGMEDVELAMSAVDRDSAAARLVLGCAALTSLAGAAGVAQRRRTQRAVARAR